MFHVIQVPWLKNIDALNKRYHLVQVQPFDLFSQTQHIETVCLFKRS